jgi:hypothetical protein
MEPSAFFYVPLTFILSPILGERIKVRGHELSIRRSIIYTNINNIKFFHPFLRTAASEPEDCGDPSHLCDDVTQVSQTQKVVAWEKIIQIRKNGRHPFA